MEFHRLIIAYHATRATSYAVVANVKAPLDVLGDVSVCLFHGLPADGQRARPDKDKVHGEVRE